MASQGGSQARQVNARQQSHQNRDSKRGSDAMRRGRPVQADHGANADEPSGPSQ